MNADLKDIGIVLLIIFILWNVFISFFAYFAGGCPPQYDIYNLSGPGEKYYDWNESVDITGPEIMARPGLADAFGNRKSILLPVGTLADFIPGDFFGSGYARTRIPIWERGYLENNFNSIWEYNGSYYKLVTTQC